MPPRSLILGFLLRFVLIFGLFILPWIGWNDTYGDYFRTLGNTVFGRNGAKEFLYFEAHRQVHGLATADSRIVLGNRDLADSTGKGPVELLSLDTRSTGWIPTALTIALILATPIPWRRRAYALLWGLVLIHAFILLSVAVYIWNESTKIALATFTPFWKQIADALEYTLITQLGISFTVPVFIWVLVAFRARDLVLKSIPSTGALGAGQVDQKQL